MPRPASLQVVFPVGSIVQVFLCCFPFVQLVSAWLSHAFGCFSISQFCLFHVFLSFSACSNVHCFSLLLILCLVFRCLFVLQFVLQFVFSLSSVVFCFSCWFILLFIVFFSICLAFQLFQVPMSNQTKKQKRPKGFSFGPNTHRPWSGSDPSRNPILRPEPWVSNPG